MSKRKTRRKWYRVKEIVIYEVLANSEAEAEELIAGNPNRDKLVVEVTTREGYLATEKRYFFQ